MGQGISSFSYEKNGKTGFVPVNFVIHHLSNSQLTQISFNSFLKALKDVSKYTLTLQPTYHYNILKVFIHEEKSGLSISLNLVSLSLHCFHPEPKTLDCHLCLFFSTTEPLWSPFLLVARSNNKFQIKKETINVSYWKQKNPDVKTHWSSLQNFSKKNKIKSPTLEPPLPPLYNNTWYMLGEKNQKMVRYTIHIVVASKHHLVSLPAI